MVIGRVRVLLVVKARHEEVVLSTLSAPNLLHIVVQTEDERFVDSVRCMPLQTTLETCQRSSDIADSECSVICPIAEPIDSDSTFYCNTPCH
jgi:hypothetical protein